MNPFPAADPIPGLPAEQTDEALTDALRFSPQALRKKYPVEVCAPLIERAKNLNPAADKLPEFAAARCLIPSLSLEQATRTAIALNRICPPGKTAIDLTGGIGADTYALAQCYEKVVYVEIRPELCATARYNFQRLGIADRTEIYCADAATLRPQDFPSAPFDFIFADPARRNLAGRRVSDPEQTYPALTSILNLMPGLGAHLSVKTAPLFDFREAFRRYPEITGAEFTSADRQMREVLYHFEAGTRNESRFKKVNAFRSEGFFEYLFEHLRDGSDSAGLLVFSEKEDKNRFAYRYAYDPDPVFRASGTATDLLQLLFDREDSVLTASGFILSEREVKPFPGKRYRTVSTGNTAEFSGKNVRLISRGLAPVRVAKMLKKLKIRSQDDFFDADSRVILPLAAGEQVLELIPD